MISDNLKLIYFRVQKTGSTSFIKTLRSSGYQLKMVGDKSIKKDARLPNLNHVPSKNLSQVIDPFKFKNYYKVAFVRNPWDRLTSMYNMSLSYKKSSVYANDKKTKLSFKDWIKAFEPQDPTLPQLGYPSHRLLMPVVDFAEHADYIGKFENIQNDFNHICTHLNIEPVELAHVNRTTRRPYQAYYDEETVELVAEKYAKDIEYFGYKFDS